jgi:hypothetical protein
MVWGSIHCAVSLPRELEDLAVRPRETALWEFVREADRWAGLGTFFRKTSIHLFIEGVPRELAYGAENRECEEGHVFKISVTECHLVPFLGKLSKKYESPTRPCTYGGDFRSSVKTCLRMEVLRAL